MIPFRIRVGVTGHRQLSRSRELEEAVVERIRRVHRLVTGETEVRLAAVSQLAEGADRLVVEAVFIAAAERGAEAHLEVVLPASRDVYPDLQGFSEESRAEFEELLDRAAVTSEPSDVRLDTEEERAAAYESASRHLMARSDVLIALWDGAESGGRGGTAETLLDAAAGSKPCIWLSTEGEREVRDNLTPASSERFYREVEQRATVLGESPWEKPEHPKEVLEPLRATYAMLDEFNRGALPEDFGSRLEEELGSAEGMPEWVAPAFVRATLLARAAQRRFNSLSWLISGLATSAAVALAIGLSFGVGSPVWAWAEAASLIAALSALVAVRRSGFHRKWLSYRVLAERLRSAHFLAPTGADFRRHSRLEAAYLGESSEDWLMRAFEEVWDRRPRGSVEQLEPYAFEELKRWLADEWIGSQIRYYEAAARRHRRRHRLMAAIVAALFLASVPFAFLHALADDVFAEDQVETAEHWATLMTIVLPAAGASLGALLTINQHKAQSERYARMIADLAVVRRTLLNANPRTLPQASSEAARVVAQETGVWVGAMWFLDIEHP